MRCPPPGRRKLAAAESAPGRGQGHRQGKGEGGGQLVGLDGQRSQQAPPSRPVAGAQNTHHQASESFRGVSVPPRLSFQRGSLHLDSLVSFAPCLASPRLTCHNFVIHFHDAVGVTAPRPAEGEGLGSRLERVDRSGDPSPPLFYRCRATTAQRGEGICPGSHSKSSRGRTSGDQTMSWLPSSHPLSA